MVLGIEISHQKSWAWELLHVVPDFNNRSLSGQMTQGQMGVEYMDLKNIISQITSGAYTYYDVFENNL